MSRSKSDYAIIATNARPNSHVKLSNAFFKIGGNFPKNFRTLFNFILRKIPYRLLGVIPPKLLIAGSIKSVEANKLPVDSNTEIVWTHDLNYDHYIRSTVKGNKKTIYCKEKYIVFLDQYLPFHLDFSIANNGVKINPEKYYGSLRRYFDHLNKTTGFDIIVAAHPSSEYENSSRYFNGYDVFKNRTADLVANCEFVLLHYSSSIVLPILYKKPMMFLTNNLLKAMPLGSTIESVACYFNLEAVNIDLNLYKKSSERHLALDEYKYKEYKEQYIKSRNSPSLYFWSIVANKLKSLNL